MNITPVPENRRILVIDDNSAIHADFRKILAKPQDGEAIAALEHKIFGEQAQPSAKRVHFEIDSALQGQDGCELVKKACEEGRPYAVAFVDVRMPPGWDGVETARELWTVDPALQVVICTAYSDYSWEEIVEKLGSAERFLILKKPFDSAEVRQLALSLTEKWKVRLGADRRLAALEQTVQDTNDKLINVKTQQEKLVISLRETHKLKTLGELATSVAYEINAPLSTILTNLEFMNQVVRAQPDELPGLRPELQKVVREASSGVERIRQIAHDLKALARADEEGLTPVDVHQVIDSALTIAGRDIKKAAQVVRKLDKVPLAQGHVGRLTQVLLSLFTNAIHALEPGKPENKITVSTLVGASGRVVVEIADNGCGIPAEDLAHIFEPFYASRLGKAAPGFGLSMAHQLTLSMQGQLTAESTMGTGTTFRISLASVATS